MMFFLKLKLNYMYLSKSLKCMVIPIFFLDTKNTY